MNTETHAQLASFIWTICNLLRGPYKRNEYRKVILPLTVLRRFDCLLAPAKAKVLAEHARIKAKPESVVRSLLEKITGRPFYNLSKLDLIKLMVNLLLSPEKDLRKSHVVKTIYDPACGTGGMLSVAEKYQKKSPSGVRTAKTDVDLIHERLKVARADYEVRYGKKA